MVIVNFILSFLLIFPEAALTLIRYVLGYLSIFVCVCSQQTAVALWLTGIKTDNMRALT